MDSWRQPKINIHKPHKSPCGLFSFSPHQQSPTMKYVLAILSASVLSLAASPPSPASPPPYIKGCSLKKSDLDKCAVEQANYALPFVVKGDKERNVPKMNPLVLPLLELIQENKWRLALKNFHIYGLENITVSNVKVSKSNLKFTLNVDNLDMKSDYEMDGRLIFLNLEGSGPSFFKFVGGSYTFDAPLSSYKSKNGKNYFQYNKPTMEYTVKRVHLQFDNLLNKEFNNTGVSPNKILDDNWDAVMEDIDVPFKDVVTTVLQGLVSSVMDDIPEKSMFPE
ncbi:uncharacterized protein LOC135142776 [Zophobas morio]|uniref:uncharacterized protein LOC135142776 n=1 Tax=Zophobas morio TaxID=2755281 RepID=UPI003083612B